MRFSPEVLQTVTETAVIFLGGQGAIALDELQLKGSGTAMALEEVVLPVPERSPAPLPNGYGAWSYGDPDYTIERVRRYNASTDKPKRIRYLFPYIGSLSFQGPERYALSWHPEKALPLAEALEDVMVLPMVDGLSRAAELLTEETWEALCRELAAKVDAESAFYGLHLDIEPHADVLYRLFAGLMEETDKPITIATGHSTPATFKYADMVVLMGYDWAAEPKAFEEAARERIGVFLKHARQGGGKAMVGVPAIATHREFESTAVSPTAERTPTGHSMTDYLGGSAQAVHAALETDATPYVGIAVWAFHPEEGLHGSRDTVWYYPTEIDDESWDKIRSAFP
jgi:hypothetical protein